MTPLVKYLLKKRSKLTNRENIQILNKKIGELISKNRRSRKGLVHVGSCVWWNKVDKLSNRVVLYQWNLSMCFQTWPCAWKKANIDPLPKVDIYVQDSDYRGINVTPVVAKASEKSVYRIFCKATVERHLCDNQFAYRGGGSCVDALLSIQDMVYGHPDNNDVRAVRLFAMDFSKAFDSVNHWLLCEKLKTLSLYPIAINWYISFLQN